MLSMCPTVQCTAMTFIKTVQSLVDVFVCICACPGQCPSCCRFGVNVAQNAMWGNESCCGCILASQPFPARKDYGPSVFCSLMAVGLMMVLKNMLQMAVTTRGVGGGGGVHRKRLEWHGVHEFCMI